MVDFYVLLKWYGVNSFFVRNETVRKSQSSRCRARWPVYFEGEIWTCALHMVRGIDRKQAFEANFHFAFSVIMLFYVSEVKSRALCYAFSMRQNQKTSRVSLFTSVWFFSYYIFFKYIITIRNRKNIQRNIMCNIQLCRKFFQVYLKLWSIVGLSNNTYFTPWINNCFWEKTVQ